jgi:hypothetical protein
MPKKRAQKIDTNDWRVSSDRASAQTVRLFDGYDFFCREIMVDGGYA